ncbi:hypothetical protein DICVIV_06948 [Dictyocaulus viviparus]|uniref:Uncharacterized protein n=1 Tax=Dictyocaulus viviparus TaxID=29172 RepID=A0A0D8XT28_DICVI|nr:hypothetical protein DICVIV_06948 [Dictyocaulus viviparus]
MDVSTTTSSSNFIVKDPKLRKECRQLKHGIIDDNNDTLSYMNLSMFRSTALFAVFSISLFVVALVASLYTDHLPSRKELKRSFVILYGTTFIRCNKNEKTFGAEEHSVVDNTPTAAPFS